MTEPTATPAPKWAVTVLRNESQWSPVILWRDGTRWTGFPVDASSARVYAADAMELLLYCERNDKQRPDRLAGFPAKETRRE